ncbi:MAG: IPT/TIG domain-containing protein, partial [Myxococcota bacterium]
VCVGDDLADADVDGVPDGCDLCAGDDLADADADGVPDACDACVGDDLADADVDGVPDACDLCVGDDHADADADGVPDACDVCVGDDHADADADGIPNACDVCTGDDLTDADADGVPDACDVCVGDDLADADADGVPDACDVCAGGDDHVDLDGNGVPDACDGCVGGACAPALWYLSPKRGPADGGITTTLIGEGFDPTCVAVFDGIDAPTTYQDAGALLAEPEAHPVGLVEVIVRCAVGEDALAGGYTYYDDLLETGVGPDLRVVLPNQVDPAGGAVVTAGGAGFAFGVTVFVDGVVAPSTVLDDTLLSIVTPPHAEGLATVEVVNPDGLGDALDGALLYVGAAGSTGVADTAAPLANPGQVGGGCSTSPVSGIAAVAIALVLARRRRAAVALLVGCSEYQVSQPTGNANPQTDGLPPVAVTGPAVEVKRDEPALLDGTPSYDPAGLGLTYAWTVDEAAPGSSATLDDATSPTPILVADQLGTYAVSLVVTDGDGQVSVNPAAQVVQVGPWQDLHLSLTWDAPVDLDLHLLAPDGVYYHATDCFFGNPTPDWGQSRVVTDDPLLATDDDGSGGGPTWGPETIALSGPEEGLYTAIVVFWNDRGTPTSAVATLAVEAEGIRIASEEITLERAGDAVVVGALDWSTLGWSFDGQATSHDALGGPPFNGG